MLPSRRPYCYAAVFLLLTGCASTNTPAQDRAWAAYSACQAEGRVNPNVQITRVEASGRWWWATRDASMGVAELTACMNEKLTAGNLAANARPPLPQSEAQKLVKFAYFTDSPPAAGIFLHTGPLMRNMPPNVKEFAPGKPVTFFYAVNQVGRVLPAQARWIGPDGGVATTANQTIDQTGSSGQWTWKTHTPAASEVARPGRWQVELLIAGSPVGRYEFTRVP
jgi:hypothetical protein